jgi:hypothetical protein
LRWTRFTSNRWQRNQSMFWQCEPSLTLNRKERQVVYFMLASWSTNSWPVKKNTMWSTLSWPDGLLIRGQSKRTPSGLLYLGQLVY